MAKSSRASKADASGGLEGMSVAQLEKEIARRRKASGGLLRRREKARLRLAALDALIAAQGGSVGGRRTRATNTMSLLSVVLDVLGAAKEPMPVPEIADAVQKKGYVSNSPSFRTIVNQCLLMNKSKIKRVSRGLYAAK